MAMAQWIKEAEEQAKKYSDSIKTSNQYLIDQLVQAKNNSLSQLDNSQKSALDQLQNQQNNALYNLNTNKSAINSNAEDSAKQANINRLLALKSNESTMNRAGLGTQGIVGSQVNSINNSYGSNLTNILNDNTTKLQNLSKSINDTNMNYDNNRLSLNNDYLANRTDLDNNYSNNIANMQKQIEDQSLNQYNTIYQTYLGLKQQEYENEQNRLAQEEAKRQSRASYNSSGGSSNNNVFSGNTSSGTDDYGNNSSTQSKSDYIFSTSKENQPRYINNTKLKSVGTMGSVFGKANMPSNIKAGQNIWFDGRNYYMWEPLSSTSGQYVNITSQYKFIKSGAQGPLRWR